MSLLARTHRAPLKTPFQLRVGVGPTGNAMRRQEAGTVAADRALRRSTGFPIN